MNRALLGAMRKGYEAACRHIGADACPYDDKRSIRGHVTFSRAFRRAWLEGWEMARADMARGDYDGWYDERAER